MVGTEISDEDRETEAALDVANGSSDDRAERYRRAKTGVTRIDGHFVVVVARHRNLLSPIMSGHHAAPAQYRFSQLSSRLHRGAPPRDLAQRW